MSKLFYKSLILRKHPWQCKCYKSIKAADISVLKCHSMSPKYFFNKD